jgi:hypothetical protein
LRRDLPGQNAKKDRLILRLQVREDFSNVRSGEIAQNLPKLREITLLDQLHQFGLQQIANHKVAWRDPRPGA